jgi:hypothetical protein
MIFAHAPVIFPAIIGGTLPFRGGFYLHLFLLHGSLLFRIAGDFALSTAVQQWGGVGNIAAVLLFLFNNLRSVMTARSQQ